MPIAMRGLAQKSASNLAIPGELVRAENLQILKGSQGGFELSKRYGTTTLPLTTSDPAVLSSGGFAAAKHIVTLGGQLVIDDVDTVAVFDAPQNAWQTHSKRGIGWSSDTESISESLYQKTCPVGAVDTVLNVEIIAWMDQETSPGSGLTYSVRSRDTGDWTAHEVVIPEGMVWSPTQKIQAFAPGNGKFYIWFKASGTTNLTVAEIPVLAPIVGSSGAPNYTLFTLTATDPAAGLFDVQAVPGIGFLVACKIVSVNDTSVFTWDPASHTVILGTSYPTTNPVFQYSWIAQSPFGANYYLAYGDSTGVTSVQFPASLVGPTPTLVAAGTATGVNNITGFLQFGAGSPTVFGDIITATATNDKIQLLNGTYADYLRSVRFASRPFRDRLGTWFAMVRYDSVAQPSLFVVNLGTGEPVAKVSTAGPSWIGATGQNQLPWPAYVGTVNEQVVIPAIAGHAQFGTTLGNPVGIEIQGIFDTHFNSAPNLTTTTLSAPVELGGTLFFPGSIPYVFDGSQIRESGFALFPEKPSAADSGVATFTNPIGTVSYIATYFRQDGLGNVIESAQSTAFAFTSVNTNAVDVSVPTYRLDHNGDVFINIWRDFTTAPSSQSPRVYRQVNDVPIPNNIAVDTVTFRDNLSEANLAARPPVYTSNSELEHIAPPSSTLVATAQNRIFLAGIDRDPSAILVSNEFVPGEEQQVSYFDGNRTSITGKITAIVGRDRNVVVFTADSIWTLTGEYPDNTGGGNGFPIPVKLPHHVGALSQDSVTVTSIGIFFQSLKGIYLLDWGFGVKYIGADIEDSLGSSRITGGVEVPALNQVRLYNGDGNTMVFDTLFATWTIFTGQNAQGATSWRGVPVYMNAGTAVLETPGIYGDSGSFIPSLVTLAFMAPAQLRGYFCLFALQLLGKVLGPHTLNASLAYSSQAFGTTSYTFSNLLIDIFGGVTYGVGTYGGTSGDGVLKVEIRPRKRQSASYQLTVWDSQLSSGPTQGFTIQAVTASVGIETDLARTQAAQRMTKA